MMKHFLLTFALLLPAAFTAQAQWSDDPAVNNRISPSNLGFYDPCYLTNQDGVTFYHYLVPNQKDGACRYTTRRASASWVPRVWWCAMSATTLGQSSTTM